MNDWLKKILVGTDGSEDAALATRAAIDLSNEAGAELHIATSGASHRLRLWHRRAWPILP